MDHSSCNISGKPSSPINRRAQGAVAEDRVAVWLQEKGYTIVVRNFYARHGEIDIVARKGHVYAIVEVKSRMRPFADQAAAITPAKQRVLVRTARWFMALNQLSHTAVIRFDVAFVEGPPMYGITYIPNAFTEQDGSF